MSNVTIQDVFDKFLPYIADRANALNVVSHCHLMWYQVSTCCAKKWKLNIFSALKTRLICRGIKSENDVYSMIKHSRNSIYVLQFQGNQAD